MSEKTPETCYILQVDFPFVGPFGAAMSEQMDGLARDIATEAGLIWKIWTENEETQRAGGIYLFDNAADAERYLIKHSARLTGFGITGIEGQIFKVNPALSKIDRAPL
jgi:Putative mono-oxygenase ydhR.